jgi:hypothetical protein
VPSFPISIPVPVVTTVGKYIEKYCLFVTKNANKEREFSHIFLGQVALPQVYLDYHNMCEVWYGSHPTVNENE